MSIRLIQSGLLSATAALLIACGGGGGGGGGNASTPPPPPSLSGIAAIGAAMANAKVTLKDSKGNTASTYADNGGNFSFSNVGGFTPPIMLRASGTVNNQPYTLHSLLTSVPSTGNINLNVTPATEALTAQTLGGTPASAFETSGSGFKGAQSAKLAAAKAKLMEALRDTLLAMDLDTEAVDLMTGKFAADQTGMDLLLDLVEFSANSQGAITLTDKKNRSESLIINETYSSKTGSKITVTVDGVRPLNTDGIEALVMKLVNAKIYKTNLAPTDFDEKFLYQGNDQTKFNQLLSTTQESSSDEYVFDSEYKIKKCDRVAKVCYLGIPVKNSSSNSVLKVIDMGVKQDESNTWKLYGDQAPFVFSFTPVLFYGEANNNQTVKNILYSEFTGKACTSCEAGNFYKARIDVSIDGGKTYLVVRKPFIYPSYNGVFSFTVDGNENTNVFSDTEAQVLNQANLSGKLKLVITAYSNSNDSSTIAWEPPVLPLLFSSGTEAKDFMSQNKWEIGEGLGSRSVAVNGEKILYTLAALFHPGYYDVFTSLYKYSELNNKRITPLNTTNVCKSFDSQKRLFGNQTCDSFLQSVKMIPLVGLTSIDDKGRAIIYVKAKLQ